MRFSYRLVARVRSMKPNRGLEGSAEQRRRSVPSSLHSSAPPQRQRGAPSRVTVLAPRSAAADRPIRKS
jgi:hypothetical protein